MKHKIYITMSLLVWCSMSCHILGKDRLTLKKLNQKVELQLSAQRNTLSRQGELVLMDSSHSDFIMVVWPRGKFTFSVANGFEGEAEKVVINAKQVGQKVLTVKDKQVHDTSSLKLNYAGQKESSTTKEKARFKIATTLAWLLLLPLFYGLYLIYKRFKIG